MIDRVRAGIKLLDEKVPGWRDKVYLEYLDVESFTRCVLGQVFGNYVAGINELGLSTGQSVEFGFNSQEACKESEEVDWDLVEREQQELTKLWLKELQ